MACSEQRFRTGFALPAVLAVTGTTGKTQTQGGQDGGPA